MERTSALFSTKHTVGRDGPLKDERTCGACTCQTNATTCVNAELAFYTDNGCGQASAVVPFDGGCHNVPSLPSSLRYRYSATAMPAGCVPFGPAPGVVDGGVSFTSDVTLSARLSLRA